MKRIIKVVLVSMATLMLFNATVFAGGSKDTEQGEITLKWASIWVGKDSKAVPVQEIVDQFNIENAGKIKVVIDPQPDYDGYEQKIRISLASNQAPADIFTIKLNPTTEKFYESPILMDFSNVMSDGWKATFNADNLVQSTVDGKLKSLPFETAILPIWYNMDMMNDAGVTEIPATMDEFFSVMDKLKDAGYYPTSQMTGGTNAWTSMIWFSHIAVSLGGANVWDKPFTDPVFVKSAEIMQKVFNDYTTPDAVGADAGVSGGNFIAARTAIFSNGPWYAGRDDLKATSFFNSIKIGGLPAAGSNKDVMIARIQANICAAQSDNEAKNAAIVTFLEYLSAPANIEKISKVSGAMFAINTDYRPEGLPAQFFDAAANAKVTAYDLEAALGSEPTLAFGQMLSSLALNLITPEEFCAKVEETIER